MANLDHERIDADNSRLSGIRHLRLKFGDIDINVLTNGGKEFPGLEVEIEQSHGVNENTKTLVMSTSVKFITENYGVIIDYANQMSFQFLHFERVVSINDGRATVLPNILSQVSLISLGTIRGILAEKLSNTPYSQVYLPLLDETFSVYTENPVAS